MESYQQPFRATAFSDVHEKILESFLNISSFLTLKTFIQSISNPFCASLTIDVQTHVAEMHLQNWNAC